MVSTTYFALVLQANQCSHTTDSLCNLLIVAVVLLNLVAAPYTKVEESFNIQATHDILVYGAPTSNIHQKLALSYDHFTFPGAVPRTFIGPLFLATFSQPFVALFGFQHAQLIVRALLGLFNASALIFFKAQLHGACGPQVARWYAILQATQFHLMFYASRTLPNMFAFGLSRSCLHSPPTPEWGLIESFQPLLPLVSCCHRRIQQKQTKESVLGSCSS